MIAADPCRPFTSRTDAYVQETLSADEAKSFEEHLAGCESCREAVRRYRAVVGLIDYLKVQKAGGQSVAGSTLHPTIQTAPSTWRERMETAPWWLVSLAMHFLVIALAGLLSMAIEPPRNDDAVITITELQRPPTVNLEQEAAKKPETALQSNLDKPPTDPTAKDLTAVDIPPEILARATLGDHFETINPDRPDTHSAFGNEDAKSFHDDHGNADAPGGGGTGGLEMESLIGFGGAASRGSGGGFGGGDGTGIGTGKGSGMGSFGQRGGGGRQLMVKQHGGSKATESSVDAALRWLAYHQEPDGHWDSVKHGASKGACDIGMTSLALLAFLGAGHTERIGQWKDNVQHAVGWLRSQQKETGEIGPRKDGYEIAMATMALAEAAGMARIKETKEAAQKAVNYCTEIHQQGEGSEKLGWRYGPKSDGDLSVTGWFVMALKSAKVAGLTVNPMSLEGAMTFVNGCEIKNVTAPGIDTGYGPASHFCYWNKDRIHMTKRTCAIGILCRQFCGWKKETLQSSVELFMSDGGVPATKKTDLYYWYYGTLCAFQQGGELWNRWNEGLKQSLPETQSKNGDDAGSWDPAGQYSGDWGRVGQTALSCLCLEVYYRYLQLSPDAK